MDKLSALLIDDEAKSRHGLRTLIGRFCPEIVICGEAEDIEEAYIQILAQQPELLFLDIQMPNGNGFSLLKKFETLPFEVIFVTSFDEYAINAIKFSALDYLLKPIEVNDLITAVNKAVKKKAGRQDSQTQLINLLNISDKNQLDKKIVAHQNDKVVLIPVDNILFIEAENRYSHIHTSGNEKFTISKTLKEFEDFFSDNPAFIRINKNEMVNINYIHNYSKGEPCIIKMLDGKTFEISRRKKQEVLDRLKK